MSQKQSPASNAELSIINHMKSVVPAPVRIVRDELCSRVVLVCSRPEQFLLLLEKLLLRKPTLLHLACLLLSCLLQGSALLSYNLRCYIPVTAPYARPLPPTPPVHIQEIPALAVLYRYVRLLWSSSPLSLLFHLLRRI